MAKKRRQMRRKNKARRKQSLGRSVQLAGNAVDVNDEDGLSWFWAFGQKDFDYEGQLVPLGSDEFYQSTIQSLTRQICDGVFHPCMIDDHDEKSRPLGTIADFRNLSELEAADLGIEQSTPFAAYVGVKLNTAGQALDDKEQLEYSSVGMHFDWPDPEDSGEVWPAYLKEFSAVNVPYLKATQVPRSNMRNLQLQDEAAAPDAVADAVEAVVGPTLGDIMELLAKLADSVEKLAGGGEEEAPAEEAPEEVEASDKKTVAERDAFKKRCVELEKRTHALELSARRRAAEDAVIELGEVGLLTEESRKFAIELHLNDDSTDKASFASFAESLKGAVSNARLVGGRKAVRYAPKQTSALSLADMEGNGPAKLDLAVRARQLSKEKGCSFSQAINQLTNEV